MADPAAVLSEGANDRPRVEDVAARSKSYSASQSYDDFASFEDSLVASSESDGGRERYASLDSEVSMLMSKDSAEGGEPDTSNRFGLPPKPNASTGKLGVSSTRGKISAALDPEDRDEIEERANRDSEPPAPSKIVRDTTEYRMYGELLHTMSSDVSARTTDLYDNYLAIVQPEESSSSSSDEDTLYATLSSGSETENNWFTDIQKDISKMLCFMEEDVREKKIQQRAAREKMRSMDARQRQKKEIRKKMAGMSPDEARAFKKKIARNKNLKSLVAKEESSTRSPKEKHSKSRPSSRSQRPSSRNQRPSSSRKSRSQRPSSSKSSKSSGSKPSTPTKEASTPTKQNDASKLNNNKNIEEVEASNATPKPSPAEAKSSIAKKSSPESKPPPSTKKQEKVEEKVEPKKESVVDKMLQEVENDAPKASDKKQPKKKWKKLFR